MTMQTIESKDVSLGELFGSFFVVPNFQREYVWGTDEVRTLLGDINAEFGAADRNEDSEYFIGTIVTCVGPDGVLQLIDGQQRMTTAYLVLCAVRDAITTGTARTALRVEGPFSSRGRCSEGRSGKGPMAWQL
jgi:uncharacterized protein with ParB-like and HNH nuclease domain